MRLHLQSDIARLKRKMTLIQAVINRGEAVHEKELEEQLDLELADWRTRVAEAVACLRHWESVARLLVRSLRSLQKKIPERSEKEGRAKARRLRPAQCPLCRRNRARSRYSSPPEACAGWLIPNR